MLGTQVLGLLYGGAGFGFDCAILLRRRRPHLGALPPPWCLEFTPALPSPRSFSCAGINLFHFSFLYASKI